MSLRFLNMNELKHLRYDQLKKQACIGKGSFASVFARSTDSDTVSKVTTDEYSYFLLADYVWHEVRSGVEAHFPRLIENHGDVGESRGRTAYLVEVERLYPVSTTEHRRLIARWAREYNALCRETYHREGQHQFRTCSLEFCRLMAEREDEPYRKVFDALYYFLRNYGGALDLKRSNFMCRADGTLVLNDVVFDVEYFNRH
ncbi:hypothetical protein G3A43_07115 [Paraburkholderia aspalathi]|nr:hypothetical protein [Paraburkholderia aspalathi]MBK3780022.1 hypothetical protein [Paraburkholderia aspalathi]